MRGGWLSLTLLLLYLVLVFLAFRLLDLIAWLGPAETFGSGGRWSGAGPQRLVDPLGLSVSQLKQLLDLRGVSYTGALEKSELVDLVKESADVVSGELEELSADPLSDEKAELGSVGEGPAFTSASHFAEEVEDTKDSVWLVHVVGGGSGGGRLLDDYSWRVVRRRVAPFHVRTGVFDCRLDPRYCVKKGWRGPLLVLALPRGSRPKDRVVMNTCTLTRPQENVHKESPTYTIFEDVKKLSHNPSCTFCIEEVIIGWDKFICTRMIVEWLREELSVRVKKVSSVREVERDWLKQEPEASSSTEGNSTTATGQQNLTVRVLLLTHLLHPPLFLAALSIKFTGRITFGIFSVKKEEGSKYGKIPKYLIITPEKTLSYGGRRGEHFNLTSMNRFLKTIQPEVNDLFLVSLLLTNMLSLLYISQISSDSWWKTLVAGIWTVVVYNLILFASWLLLCGALCWPLFSSLGVVLSRLVRESALSEVGSWVRWDWERLLGCLPLLVGSLLAVGRLGGRWLSEGPDGGTRRTSSSSAGRESVWWEMDCLFRPSTPPLSSAGQPQEEEEQTEVELEEGLLIERLAVPALWLSPPSTPHYLSRLKVWTFVSRIPSDSPQAIERLMDSDSDEGVRSLCRGEDLLLAGRTGGGEECAICLEPYTEGDRLSGLPCSHSYHQSCILAWLLRDNHHCPICRWPAYKNKQH